MRYLKLKKLSIYFAGLAMLSACSSDNISDEPVVAPEDSPFYLHFELAQSNITDPATRSGDTRAGDSSDIDTDKTVKECRINSLIAFMVDGEGTQKDYIVGVARPQGYDIVPKLKDGKAYGAYTVKANMGLVSLYKREHTYRIYVFANLEEASYTALASSVGKKITDIGKDINMGETGMKPILVSDVAKDTGYETLKFSTLESDAVKVKIWLDKDTEYSATNPYILQTDNTTDEGTLMLTPLQACFWLEDFSESKNFTYPIQYTAGETGATGSVTEVKVQFKKGQVLNAAQKQYLLPQGLESAFTLSSPSAPGFSTSSKFNVAAGKAIYVPEYIPAVSNNTLRYSDATYMMLEGILVADADCTALDSNVKNEITNAASAHRPLYYFDDGKYQSGLTLVAHEGEANWRKITYDATLGGYKVAYYHAIRHNAGTGRNEDDGKVYPLEYGVVRNYIYQIGVNSVSALPHPFSTSDNVESDKKDINIRINPPAKWTYHRGGYEIIFE